MIIDLRYFTPTEFRDWWPHMSLRLLVLMDSGRHQWGDQWEISPVEGALGRHRGDALTQHNIDRWDEVRAADFFMHGMDTRVKARHAVDLMVRTGFTGIGVYPDWDPMPGVHGDVRQDRDPGDPAIWGMIDDGQGQYQVSLEHALERMA